jgi:hypothetical protein
VSGWSTPGALAHGAHWGGRPAEYPYWTVRVRVKDCTVVPEFAAMIFTVEVPAGVAGALGVLGAVGVVD